MFFTKGVGHHRNKLQSFELALRNAGIEKCNLVHVSSIFPPDCKIISKEAGIKELNPGQMTFVVLARESTNEPNRLVSAAIVFSSGQTGFIVLGGGGPKNFIQQTSPTLSQILKIKFDGAERGIQIGTAVEKEGSLSGCTFSESVTWGKYRKADDDKLIQIWGEYSVTFPILTAYALEICNKRPAQNIISQIPVYVENMEAVI